jgi:hypothetical protein
MNNTKITSLLLTFMFALAGCSSSILRREPSPGVRGYVKPELAGIERIAILPFKGDVDNLFSDEFSISLGTHTDFKIVERREVEELFAEQDFYPERIDARTAARIGRMLGVQALVLGDVLGVEEILGNYQGTLKLRIVHVETGAVLAQFIDSGHAEKVSERIAKRLQGGL